MAVTTAEENERIATEHFDRVWNQDEFDTDVLTEDYHVVTNMGGREELTTEEYQKKIKEFKEAFPDLRKEPKQVIATEETVVIQYTFVGTHKAQLKDIPPTGNEVEIEAVDIVDMEDGKIAREWFTADFLRMMHQLEVMD